MKKYTLVDYVFQFITITAGVLIALLINGLVAGNNNRELVEQARKAIDLVANSTSLVAGGLDPTAANKEDLRAFRLQVMLLQSNLMVTQQLGEQLIKGYQEFLQK